MNKINSCKCTSVDLMTKSWMMFLTDNSCNEASTVAVTLLPSETNLNGSDRFLIRPSLYFTNQRTLDPFQNIAPCSEYLHYSDNSYRSVSTYEVAGSCKAWRLSY